MHLRKLVRTTLLECSELTWARKADRLVHRQQLGIGEEGMCGRIGEEDMCGRIGEEGMCGRTHKQRVVLVYLEPGTAGRERASLVWPGGAKN